MASMAQKTPSPLIIPAKGQVVAPSQQSPIPPPPPLPPPSFLERNLLDTKIAAIFKNSIDPFDATDFDPIEHINSLFPIEQSFTSLDSITSKLRFKLNMMDRNIREMLRTQTEGEEDGGIKVLDHATESIKTLYTEIKNIKEKAKHAEKTVQDITKDIKSLDQAKRNLTNSVTVLKRLQMLGSAVDQLRTLISKRQYKEIAKLLQATQELSVHFQTFRNIKQISDRLDAIANIQLDLKKMLFSDFEGAFTQQGAFTGIPALLTDACTVIDALDKDVKRQLLDWYCDLQLRDYKFNFQNNDDLGGLDNVARRYAWLKRVCKAYDEEQALFFPASWRVSELTCEKFCDITRDNLAGIMARNNHPDVRILIKSLQMTLDFENGLNRRFSSIAVESAAPGSADPIVETSTKFTGKISIAYEPYMKFYIEAEEKTLSEMIEKFKSVTSAGEEDVQTGVFTSSTDLFYFYRQTLVAMAKLNTRKPFLDLSKLFAKWLTVYCDMLSAKLSKEDKRPALANEIKMSCLILNTADYCQNTTIQLEEKIKEKIDPEFSKFVDMSKERDAFLLLITSAIQTIVRQVCSCLYIGVQAMSKIPWGSLQTVGDQSEYVTIIGSTLTMHVVNIRKLITNGKHFKWFCDKYVDSFLPWYIKTIHTCKPISEVGAEQMLLDTLAIKTILLEMPNMGAEEKHPPPPAFTKFVIKGIAKAETLLKVVLTPLDPFEAVIKNYMILSISDGGDTENQVNTHQRVMELRDGFIKILDLKGVKKMEQQPLVDMLMARVSSQNSNMPSLKMTPISPAPAPAAPGTSGFSSLASGLASISMSTAANSVPLGSIGDAGTKLNENFKRFAAAMDIKSGWLKRDPSATSGSTSTTKK